MTWPSEATAGLQTSHMEYGDTDEANYISAEVNVGREFLRTRCPIPPDASRPYMDHRAPPGRKEREGEVRGGTDGMFIQISLSVESRGNTPLGLALCT